MSMFAQGFAPVLSRAAMAVVVSAAALLLAACSDEGKLVLHSSTGDYSFNVEVVTVELERGCRPSTTLRPCLRRAREAGWCR